MTPRKARAATAARARRRRPLPRRSSIAQNTDVLNWVRSMHRAGHGQDELVKLSRTAEDYPAPGRPLSAGTFSACLVAIYHLERVGVRWPLPPDGAGRGTMPNGKRLRQVRQRRAAARAAGESDHLWELAAQIGKLCGLVYSALPAVYAADLDEANVDTLVDLEVDVLYLAEWADRFGRQIEARLGELPLRRKIQALRSKTVAAGATLAEQQLAQAAADRLERRLAQVLAS